MDCEDLWLIIWIVIFLYHVPVEILCLWLLKRYGVKLKIGGYGFFYFSDIHVQLKDGLQLEIKRAGFSSRIFNSSHLRLIALYINGIRIQGDTDMFISQTSKKKSSEEKKSTFSFMKYAFILKLLSIHISNASLRQLGKSEEFLFHLSFQEIYLCFYPKLNGILFSTFVKSSHVRVFERVPVDKKDEGACMCYFKSNLHLDLQLNQDKRVLFELIKIDIDDPELLLYKGFSLTKIKTYIQNVLQRKRQCARVAASIKEDDVPASTSLKNRIQILPKTCELTIHSFSAKVMMGDGHRTLLFAIEFVSWCFEKEELTDIELPIVTFNIQVKEISAVCDHNEIGLLQKLEFDSDVSDKVIRANFEISHIHLLYNKEVLQYCLIMPLLSAQKAKQMSSTKTQRKKGLVELFNGYKLNVSAVVKDIRASFKLPLDEMFSFGFLNCLISFEHVIGGRRPDDDTSTKNSFYGNLVLETVYVKFGKSTITDGILKGHHSIFIPLHIDYLGIMAKPNQSDKVVDCNFCDCSLQLNPKLYDALIYLQTNVISNFLQSKLQESDLQSENAELPTAEKKKPSLSIKFIGLNLFALNELNAGIAIRTDVLNINSSEKVMKVAIDGMKLIPFTILAPFYQCIETSEIEDCNVHLANVSIIFLKKIKEIAVVLSKDIFLFWNADLYKTIRRIADEGRDFKKNIQECLKSSLSAGKPDVKFPDTAKVTNPVTIFLQASGEINIGWPLSEEHESVISSSYVSLSYSSNELSLSSSHITWVIDEMDVYDFEKVEIFLCPGNKQHHFNPQGFNKLVQLSGNRLLSIHFDDVELTLPHTDMSDELFDLEEIPFIGRILKDQLSTHLQHYVFESVFKHLNFL